MASFPFFLAMKVSIFCIGPGRYNALTAAISSMFSGSNLRKTFRIPADSNWNTPEVSPRWNKSSVFASFSGISFNRISYPSTRLTAFKVKSIIDKLRSPKKSIFKRPIASTSFIVYWVRKASSEPRWSGTSSSRFLSLITTPAAWVETCLGNPSKITAVLNKSWFFSLAWTNSTNWCEVL